MKTAGIRFELEDVSYRLKQSARIINNFIGSNYALGDDDDLQGFILDLACECVENCHLKLDKIVDKLMRCKDGN